MSLLFKIVDRDSLTGSLSAQWTAKNREANSRAFVLLALDDKASIIIYG